MKKYVIEPSKSNNILTDDINKRMDYPKAVRADKRITTVCCP